MVTYLESLQAGLRAAMQGDNRIYFLGEDVLDPYGGAFKVSQGLSTAFPGRVMTTPISEAGIVGVGVGMALRGLKPVVEIMFGDFTTLTADQIINYGSKLQPMYNGQVEVPLVVRTPMGGRRGYGPTHSQSIEKLYMGVPHLDIVAPSIFHQPGDLIQTTLTESTHVTLFIEHKQLYNTRLFEAAAHPGIHVSSVQHGSYPTAVVKNYSSGAPDVALVAYGGSSLLVLEVMKRLLQEEIRVVAAVPASVQPVPADDLVEAIGAAKQVIVVEEGTYAFGWGAEIASTLHTRLWGKLQKPVRRIAAMDTIIPAAKPLEELVLPSVADIENAIYEVMT